MRKRGLTPGGVRATIALLILLPLALAAQSPPPPDKGLDTLIDSLALPPAPEKVDTLQLIRDNRSLGLLEEGRALQAEGDLRGAERKFYAACFTDSRDLKIQARLGLARVYSQQRNRKFFAVSEYRQVLDLDPNCREALYELAEIGFELEWTQGYTIASKSLQRLIYIDPEYRDCYELWRKGIRDQEADELQGVGGFLRGWLPRHRERGYWWLDLAWDSFRLDDIPETLACLDSLRVDWPKYKLSEQDLITARCFLEQGDTLAFETEYHRAVETAAQEGGFERLSLDAQTIMTPGEKKRWAGLQGTEQAATLFRQFWLRRDPDPTTPHNERLVEHYVRLARAEKFYKLQFPHSKVQTSSEYRRLTSPSSHMMEYDDEKVIGNLGSAMLLDQRALLYIRHGPPAQIKKPDIDQSPYPVEAWDYKGGFFLFAKKSGDFQFVPMTIPGAGDMQKALSTESFRDPLPEVSYDYYGTDFQGLDDQVEVEFYQSLPRSESADPPAALAVLYDTTWTEVDRDSTLSVPVATQSDSLWLAVNRLIHRPGNYFYAVKLCLPGRRAIYRKELHLVSYTGRELDISGVVLGSLPPTDRIPPLERLGVELLPRPSLKFTPGEAVAVYFEIYGLKPGRDGRCGWDEKVTVTAAAETGGGIKGLFGGGKQRKSLTLSFNRSLDSAGGAAPEHFTLDTAPLAPGRYRLRLEITDSVSGEHRQMDWYFELEGLRLSATK